MKLTRYIAAALAALMLSACVGFVVPLPAHDSNSSRSNDNERR